MSLVFQFGSNASSQRLNSPSRLDGAAKPLTLARTVELFDFCFSNYSCTNNCATADIIPHGSRHIFGVLYEIPDDRIYRKLSLGQTCLDKIEGEGKSYERTKLSVEAISLFRQYEAISYLVKNRTEGIKTSIGYVSEIIKGLREHNAPEEYIVYVKNCAIKNNPDINTKLDEL